MPSGDRHRVINTQWRNVMSLSCYASVMIRQHLLDKRDELLWALSDQGYNLADLCVIFNITHRNTVLRIINRKPAGWVSRWVKRDV